MVSQPRFPTGLDDDFTLYHVFNTSEAALSSPVGVYDDEISIEPRGWSDPEVWAATGGIVNIEGEIVRYSSVITEERTPPPPVDPNFSFFDDPNVADEEKSKYKRVVGFSGLERGIGATSARQHFEGEIVRGFVMAEHHNALGAAIIGAESLIGIDNSTDHDSIDYRLRDLEELVVENDDIDCPYGVFWHEELSRDGFSKEIQFHVTIIGEYERFELTPRPGADPVIDVLDPVVRYGLGEEIKATLTVFLDRCCACVSSGDIVCEPCEFDALLEDIPLLPCPDVIIPEMPGVTVDCEVTCEVCETCEECITPTCPEIGTQPDTSIIEPFDTVRNIEITVNTQTVDVNVSVDISWKTDYISPGDESGACFMLVPCGGTTS